MSQTTFCQGVGEQCSLAFIWHSTFPLLQDYSQPVMPVTSLWTPRPMKRFSSANLAMMFLSLRPTYLELANELARLRYQGWNSGLLFFKAILLKSCVEA